MSKLVTADYDPETKTLTLREPLEGVRFGGEVRVEVPPAPRSADYAERLARLRGSLSKEAGDSFAKAIEEAFPPWNDPNDF
jgi:hypothetical protein